VSIVQSRDDGMSTRALSVYLAWLFATKPFYCCYLSVRISIMSAMQDQQCAFRDACIGLQNADVVHIASHGEGAVPSSDSIPASPCPQRFCQSELECRHAQSLWVTVAARLRMAGVHSSFPSEWPASSE
jgi:hypothetical protein